MLSKSFTLAIVLILFTLLSCSNTSTGTKDEESPTATITNPSNNSEWDEGVFVSIIAEATDNEGISKVDFYVDGTLEFSDAEADYRYEWNTSDKAGDHIIQARAYDTNDNNSNSALVNVKIINDAPVASFIVNPVSGDTTTIFHVDASGCTDTEDDVSALEVRWDWEADGTWDTDYSTTKTADLKYASDGTKQILLEVKDTNGQTDTTSLLVIITTDSGDPGTVTDIDGNEYTTVKIGNQWWLVENLRVTKYRDGSAIPFVYQSGSWVLASSGAYCYYDLSSDNISEYGLLYNFHAVNNAKGLAPEGWHVPSDDEWKEMEMYLGMTQEEVDKTLMRGTDEGGKLKETGTTLWLSNIGATNETGFTALPAAWRSPYDGSFSGIGTFTSFWTSTGTTSSNSTYALTRGLTSSEARMSRSGSLRVAGLAVRCVKD